MYWGALTTAGMETIATSEFSGIQLRIFFGLVTYLMDKETNEIPQTKKDILTDLKSHNIDLGQATLYRALKELVNAQFLTELWVKNENKQKKKKRGYMVNPFIIYFGRQPNLPEKLKEFERLTELAVEPDTNGEIYSMARFTITPELFELIHDEMELPTNQTKTIWG